MLCIEHKLGTFTTRNQIGEATENYGGLLVGNLDQEGKALFNYWEQYIN